MLFGKFGIGEIALIVVIVLLLFGAKRIPEVAGAFGKGIRAFKRGTQEMEDSVAEVWHGQGDRRSAVTGSPARDTDDGRIEPRRLA
jgi:sec-independent protein translocase protein TatA